jgi:mannose-6-phosphate isomerase-like protein (cupin superfamily)
MSGDIKNIEEETLKNNNFRKVLYTAPHSQLVAMSLKPGEDIGLETHETDQFFRIEQGSGVMQIGKTKTKVSDDWAAVVPAGAKHNLANTGKANLKLYTIYSPQQHPKGTVHKTRAEAMAAEEHEH